MRASPEEYIYDSLSNVSDFNGRVYSERQSVAKFPSVVFYASGGEVTDTNRRFKLSAQDFRLEIRVGESGQVQGTKNLTRIRKESIEELRKGGRLIRMEAPISIYDPAANAHREIVEVRIKN